MPGVGKVYESVTAPDVPAALIGFVGVPITTAPAPDAFVAVWKTSVKVVPVEETPVLVIVDESVTAIPAVAAVGVGAVAVRFAPVTVTAVHTPQLSSSFDSATVPTNDALLSAHARTNTVPAVPKV